MRPRKNSAKLRLKIIRTAALLVWVVVLMAPSVARAQQSAAPKRVLVLYWYGKDFPANVRFDQSFQAALPSAPGGTVEYYPEYLESDRFPGESQAQGLCDYLRRKYADRTIDVVVAAGRPALDSLLKNRNGLFTKTPIVFLMSSYPMKEELAAGPGLTGIVTNNTYRKTLDLALRLHPGTEQVFIISGTLERDKRIETMAREELQGYESRARVSYLTDLAPDELIARTKSLPERSIVLYVWQQSTNEQGKVLESADVLALIAKSAPVPIYGMSGNNVGRGIVGGYVFTTEGNANRAAEIALRIANGARSRDIPVENAPTLPMFDWRELRRWGISENQLPPGSVIQFREPSFWDHYKWRIIGVISLCAVEGLLIFALLAQRARRRRVEEALRDNEERLKLALSASNMGAWDWRLDTGELKWSDEMRQIFGFAGAKSDVTTELFLGLIHPNDRPAITQAVTRTINQGAPYDVEFRTVHDDGSMHWVMGKGKALLDEAGQAARMLGVNMDITDRKRAEERLRSYFELPLIGMAITSPDRRFVEVNQKLCDILGYSKDQLAGMSWVDVTHPDDVAENIRLLDETLRGNTEGYVMDKRFIHRDGHIVYTSISARCARRADRSVDYLALIIQDITQRKQAEDRLMESEAQLRLLTELIPQHIWTGFPGNIADYRNQRWLDYTGMTIEEVRQKGWMTALHPDDHERVVNAIREASSQKGIYEVEIRLKGVDGHYRWFLSRALPQLDQEGNIIKWYGTNTDIEDRKRAGEALRESEERLRHALEAGRMGVWERDTRTDADNWSKESYTILGLSPFSIEPSYQTWADRLHPDDLPVANEKMRKGIEEKGDFRYEYRIIWPDGSVRWVEGHGKPVYDEDGQCLKVSGLIVDITERKLAYLRLNTQYAISHILSEAASVAEAASRLLQVICESLGWEFGEIWQVDREADHLTFLESWSQPSRELAEFASASRQFTFLPGDGLPGRVWKSRQPVWITDVAGGSFPRASLARRAGLHNGVGFPALLGDETLGVMVFFSRDVREPDEGLLQMMASIGSQIGQFAERKQAEDALRESEARFRNMADNAPVMVWMTEADGACSYLSQSWYEFTSQTPETGLGFGWVAALHPDDRELSEKTFLAANEKREAFRLEYRLRRNDGEYRWASDSAKPRFGSQGEFLGYIGSVVDITETKKAELNTQFINQLDFELSQIADADEIIRLATSRLGEYLGVSRCYVIEVSQAADLVFVRESWNGWGHDGKIVVGEYRMSDFVTPECLYEFEAGRATVVRDVTTDPRMRDFTSKYESLGVGAFISIPALNEKQ